LHDTIVAFDRVRENFMRAPGAPFEEVVNHALSQTMVRLLGTSTTTLLVLVALLLFGGVTIRPFVLAGREATPLSLTHAPVSPPAPGRPP
jgi:preprotein translocase subunit SecF